MQVTIFTTDIAFIYITNPPKMTFNNHTKPIKLNVIINTVTVTIRAHI